MVDCDIIKDLLPSYIDKTSSDSTNELIIEHLQKCQNCSTIITNLNKDIDIKPLFSQDEQIDYLKGYRNDRTKAVIKTILISAIIILLLLLVLQYICIHMEFFVDVNTVPIVYVGQKKNNENILQLVFESWDKKSDLSFKHEEKEDNVIYIKVVKKYNFNNSFRTFFYVDINENTKQVYLEDKQGNLKEIWNKEQGILTEIE